MSICSIVTQAVHQRLREAVANGRLVGVKEHEIQILPEGRVAPTVGQRAVTLSPEREVRINTPTLYAAKRLSFSIHVITRIRDIPNDEFGTIYTDPTQLAELHSLIADEIESFDMLQDLIAANELVRLEDKYVENPDAVSSEDRPVRYSITRAFIHHSTHLDPIHLYPSYFLAKSSNNDSKIAGYRTYSSFSSPVFFRNFNPLMCTPLFSPT